MTTIPRGEQTVISRLHVGGAVRDPLLARLRLEGMLAAAELRPRSLPPSAVVCVRALSAPRGTLRLLGEGGRHASHSRHEWRRALADALDRAAARAARPIHGPVPRDAEAVVFADHAELLACLALDWLAQAVASGWWWRGILRGADASSAVRSEWLGSPEYVPAALEHLARAGGAAEFVAALGVEASGGLTRRVAQVFALGDLAAALDEARGAHATPTRTRVPSAEEGGQPPSAPKRVAGGAPPWRRFVAEGGATSLDIEAECLLGVGLMLARAPSVARAPSFARDVREWLGALEVGAPPAHGLGLVSASLDERAGGGARASGGEFEQERPGKSAEAARPLTGGGPGALPPAGFDTNETRPAGPPHVEESSFTPRLRESLQTRQRAPSVEGRGDEKDVVDIQTTSEGGRTSATDLRPAYVEAGTAVVPESPRPEPHPLEARAETRLGGLFYLINVGLSLGLYGDFTTPLRPGLALPLWDFVALVGRRLCGAGDVEEDAVWPLLARLAGRVEGEPPGLHFEPPSDWRAPSDWLKPFPEPGVWHWSAGGGRLRVRHHEGFTLLEVAARGGDPSREARSEAAAYAAASFELRRAEADEGFGHAAHGAHGGERLGRWVELLSDYVSARLRRALGAGDAGAPARVAFEQEARVVVTATRVEVLFQLAQLPIEVRLAGLDRDPGWVPSAGRFVAFRYE